MLEEVEAQARPPAAAEALETIGQEAVWWGTGARPGFISRIERLEARYHRGGMQRTVPGAGASHNSSVGFAPGVSAHPGSCDEVQHILARRPGMRTSLGFLPAV